MPNIAEIRIGLSRCVEELNRRFQKAQNLIMDDKNCEGEVMLLPLKNSFNEYNGKQPRIVEGQTAVEYAVKMLGLFIYERDQDKKKAKRLPGYIVVNRQAFDTLLSLNQQKKVFQGLWSKLDQETRQIVRKNTPILMNLSAIQVRREIRLFKTPPLSIHFSWKRSLKMDRLSKKEAIDLLNEQKKYPSPKVSVSDWNQMIEHDLIQIDSISDNESLVRKREDQIRPFYTALFNRHHETDQSSLSVPICILRPSDHTPNKIKIDWSNKEPTKRQETVTESDPINSFLGLYRYRPEYLENIPPNPVPAKVEGKFTFPTAKLTFKFSRENVGDPIEISGDHVKLVKALAKFLLSKVLKNPVTWRASLSSGILSFRKLASKYAFVEIRQDNKVTYIKCPRTELRDLLQKSIRSLRS